MRDKVLDLLKSVKRDGMESLIKWLCETDFFRAPASSAHHLNYEGGLVEHSLNVYQALLGIAGKYDTKTPKDSIIIAGLLHDVCKINLYVRDFKNQKINGKWEQVEYWKYEDKDPLGHGERSVINLQEHIKLTKDEQYAIRYHMGPWNETDQMQRNTLNAAMKKCRLLRCLMVADQVATFFIEDPEKQGE